MKAKFRNRVSVSTKINLKKYIIIGISLSLFISIGTYIYFYFGNIEKAKAANTVRNSVNERTGSWDTGSSWTSNAIPGSGDDYVINGTITKTGNISLGNDQSLTVSSGDTLTIIGNLSLGNKGILAVASNAVLIVKGNYSTQNQTNDVVQSQGTLIITGTISFSGSGSNITANSNSYVYYDTSLNPGISSSITGGGSSGSITAIPSNSGLLTLLAPTITSISAQQVDMNTATGSIAFTVGDATVSASSLTVTASSSNTTIVPNANCVLGGSGASRTITVTPATDVVGSATITVSVNNGTATTTTTFVVTVGNTWIGTTTNWSTASNWALGLPSSTRSAYIPTTPSGGNFPVVGSSVNTNSIIISSGASVTVNPSTTLSVKGNFTNNGSSYTGSGNITFDGSSAQTIKGNISSFTVSNSNGVTLSGDVTANSTVTLSTGTLSVTGNSLTLSNPIAGTASNLVTSSSSSLVISGSASGINIPSSISSLNNLTISNSNGATMQGNLAISTTLTLTSGALSINGNTLTLNGSASTTSGTISGSSSSNLTIGGSGALGTIAFTSGARTLNNLTLNRSTSGSITLGSDLTVSNQLTLTNGKIITGSNILAVSNTSTSAITGHSTASYINGNLRRHIAPTGSYDLPVGSNVNYEAANITLNSSANILYLDAKYTTSIDGSLPNFYMGSNHVDNILNGGYWTITPDAVTSANYDVTFTSRGHTNGGALAEQHTIVKRESSSYSWGSYGTHIASATTGTGSNPITSKRTGITSFSDYGVGLSSGGGVLPIELIDFNAELSNNLVKLKWTTLTESNNDHFEIERSNSGDKFTMIGKVSGSRNSTTKKMYQYIDASSFDGKIYYRLKQVDTDGKQTYSQIIAVENNNRVRALSVEIFPNPTRYDNISLKINAPIISQKATVSLMNVEGKVLFAQEYDGAMLSDPISFRMPMILAPKTYFINVKQGSASVIKPLIIIE